MKRVLLDQGCPRSTASILNSQGWDVLHAGDVGLSATTDAEILERARIDDRVCVTLDADFHAILALSGAEGPSTVRIRIEGLRAEALAALLLRAWPRIEADLQPGALVTIDLTSIRVRRLPVSRRRLG